MSLSHRDEILWSVNVTINNLDAKTYWSKNRPSILLLGFIPVVYKQAKDLNNKNRDLSPKSIIWLWKLCLNIYNLFIIYNISKKYTN